MKHIILIAMLSFLLQWNIQRLEACTCLGTPSVERALVFDDVVFIGKVISVKQDSTIIEAPYQPSLRAFITKGSVRSFRIAGFEVTKMYKGTPATDTIFIRTGLGGGDCGFDFTIGEKYIVYGRYQDENKPGKMSIYITTNICMRTKAYDAEEVAEIENQIKLQEKRKE